jgi:hypothetical protein
VENVRLLQDDISVVHVEALLDMPAGPLAGHHRALLSGVELGLFTTLGAKAMTGGELQAALQLHLRANPDFFDTRVALRFLERDGDTSRYRNSAETALFLDRNSPLFMGGFLEMANARLYLQACRTRADLKVRTTIRRSLRPAPSTTPC